MLSFQVKFVQTDRWTDGRTTVKQYAPDLSIRGHKKFAGNNFKFDESGGKFSKQVENTLGKEEIARYEQFLIFPQCFQRIYTA